MSNDEKKIEDVVNKLMTVDSLEEAPLNFTKNVMSKVEALSHDTKTIEYKPLISKTAWFLIIGGFLALVAYIQLQQPSTSSSWLDRNNWPNISFNPLENISVNFSSTLMYAVALFAIMISIQVPLLKHYFNKHLSF